MQAYFTNSCFWLYVYSLYEENNLNFWKKNLCLLILYHIKHQLILFLYISHIFGKLLFFDMYFVMLERKQIVFLKINRHFHLLITEDIRKSKLANMALAKNNVSTCIIICIIVNIKLNRSKNMNPPFKDRMIFYNLYKYLLKWKKNSCWHLIEWVR